MPTFHTNDIHGKSTRSRLSSTRRLAESLLVAIEGEEFAALQDQSIDALKSLLRILCEAIRMYERERQEESKKGRKPESLKARIFQPIVFRLSGFLDFRHSGFLFSYKPISP